MRVILLAGGSGGHISPALAVASELKKLKSETTLLFLCSRGAIDREIYSQENVTFVPVFSGKIRRYCSFQNLLDPFLLFFGILQCFFLFLRFRPDVIFSKGGFVALPGCIAAWVLRIPLVVHESDATPGLATKFSRHFARRVLTTFPTAFGEQVGTPIRPAILFGDAQKGKKFLGFTSKKPLLFGFGGSQGSSFINRLLIDSLDTLLPALDIVWISGPQQEHLFPQRQGLRVFSYLHEEFSHVLAAADIVVSRSGSNSLFEIAAAKKPALLIPLASSAGDHQARNAEAFLQNGAAEVMLEKDARANSFSRVLLQLASDKAHRIELSEAIARFSQPNAAVRIANILVHTVIDAISNYIAKS